MSAPYIPPTHIVAGSAWVTNIDNHVLMVKHPKRGWEMPGGQIENGETLMAGIIREVLEETGTTIEITDLVGMYSNIAPPTKVIFSFMGTYISGELIPSAESPQVEWVPQHDALARITHPALRLRAEDALNFAGTVVYRAYTMPPFVVHHRQDI